MSEPEPALQTLSSPALQGRVLAIANQKGGVGKTTTAVNLATAMAAIKKRVLLIDLDPQGNASTGLGVNHRTRRNGIYSVLVDEAGIDDVLTPSMVPYLDIVPASVSLSGAELELVHMDHREHRLRQALQQMTRTYDFIMIDCPPALGLLTLNAMVAADGVLVPMQCEYYALEGLSYLIKTIERVRKVFNPRLDLQGVVLTMYDSRNRLSEQVASDVRGHFGATVYETVIPRNVRISEAPSHGKPVILYDTRCIGARAYVSLAREVLKRETALKATAQQKIHDKDMVSA